jgi:hypothetical protein
MSTHSSQQKELCLRHGAAFEPPLAASRVGIALQTLHLLPLHGLRHPPERGTNGWYIWAGELSDGEDFFQPLCVEHLPERCPLAFQFLGLPPGWRFLTDGDYIDVWYDAKLLETA